MRRIFNPISFLGGQQDRLVGNDAASSLSTGAGRGRGVAETSTAVSNNNSRSFMFGTRHHTIMKVPKKEEIEEDKVMDMSIFEDASDDEQQDERMIIPHDLNDDHNQYGDAFSDEYGDYHRDKKTLADEQQCESEESPSKSIDINEEKRQSTIMRINPVSSSRKSDINMVGSSTKNLSSNQLDDKSHPAISNNRPMALSAPLNPSIQTPLSAEEVIQAQQKDAAELIAITGKGKYFKTSIQANKASEYLQKKSASTPSTALQPVTIAPSSRKEPIDVEVPVTATTVATALATLKKNLNESRGHTIHVTNVATSQSKKPPTLIHNQAGSPSRTLVEPIERHNPSLLLKDNSKSALQQSDSLFSGLFVQKMVLGDAKLHRQLETPYQILVSNLKDIGEETISRCKELNYHSREESESNFEKECETVADALIFQISRATQSAASAAFIELKGRHDAILKSQAQDTVTNKVRTLGKRTEKAMREDANSTISEMKREHEQAIKKLKTEIAETKLLSVNTCNFVNITSTHVLRGKEKF